MRRTGGRMPGNRPGTPAGSPGLSPTALVASPGVRTGRSGSGSGVAFSLAGPSPWLAGAREGMGPALSRRPTGMGPECKGRLAPGTERAARAGFPRAPHAYPATPGPAHRHLDDAAGQSRSDAQLARMAAELGIRHLAWRVAPGSALTVASGAARSTGCIPRSLAPGSGPSLATGQEHAHRPLLGLPSITALCRLLLICHKGTMGGRGGSLKVVGITAQT